MTYRYCSKCEACGGPTFVPEVWHGIYPPKPQCILCKPTESPWNGKVNIDDKGGVDWVKANPLKTFQLAPVPAPETAQQIADTRKLLESIKEKRRLEEEAMIAEADEKARETERAMRALEQSMQEEETGSKSGPQDTIAELERRVDTLETMMINTAQVLTEIRAILREKHAPTTTTGIHSPDEGDDRRCEGGFWAENS